MSFSSFLSEFLLSSDIKHVFSAVFGVVTMTRVTQFFFSVFLVGFVFYLIRRVFG